ncbi:MAG TPA: efflux RND transporter permease subunit [Bryobacteraceae bacterium]|nr:efflux RND transporter permease subunit [Bryobacteraceae bacterium]
MQKLAEVCIARPIFAVMLIMALVVVGGVSYTKLGIDRFPNVDLPIISVRTVLPGASPEEMESTITRRIEDAVATVEGIENIRSTSTDSQSILTITFTLKRDIDVAAQDVRDAVAGVISLLPRDAKPPLIKKLDTDSSPVISLVVAGNKTPRELFEIADRDVRDSIESVSGVGLVQALGGQKRAINVWVDADRLAAYKIPILKVRDAVARQNSDIPGGRVDEGRRELVLRTMSRFPDPRQFNDLVVATIGNTPVRVRDIGYAEDGHKEQRTSARYDGKPAVTLQVQRQSGANSIEVIRGVKARLDRIRKVLPPGVTVDVVQDQSRYIEAAFHEVQLHLILGSILASLVVMLFMRNWRATVISAVAIPASIISAFGMMRALNFTLNNITMLALVLMVGVVIDDAIVVLENIFRYIEEKKIPPRQAAVLATRDIGLAVMATTLSLVVIFLPVSFMSSVSGRFLYSFGVTAAVAIMVSLLVSFSLTPMMSSRMLSLSQHSAGHGDSRSGFYGVIDRAYTGLLGWSMRHRWTVSFCALLVMASSAPLYKMVRQEYVPTNVDESEFEMSVFGSEAASLASMDDMLARLDKDLFSLPGVQHVLWSTGGSYLGVVNISTGFIRITDIEDRSFSPTRLWRKTLEGKPLEAFRGIYSQKDVMQAIRQRVKKYPDLRVSVRNVMTLNQGSAPVDIDFSIRGPDLLALNRYSEQLRQAAGQIPGLVDIDTTLRLNKPELRVAIDRDRAADLGVDASDIADSLRIMVGGDDEVSRFRDEKLADDYDVEVRLTGVDRRNADTIAKLFVPSRTGLVRLDNVVKLTEGTTAYRIEGLDRQRNVALRANISPGYALADRLVEMAKAAEKLNMPVAYSTTVIGRGRELERTFGEFLLAFLLSVVFMYMILASQFESLVHPITILLSLPLAVPFGFLSLWFFNDTLNLYSALGILVLFGVVKKNSILQIDHTNTLRREGMERMEAIMQANRDRLRPILMTTLTLVAGMAPLALGTGPGAEERRSIAIVVIGGQSLSLLLTLIVTPVAYSIFDDFGRWLAKWRRPKTTTTQSHEVAV